MLARLFGPAARKIRFHVKLTISRLTNLPLRDCQCFVKWKGDRVGGSTGTTSQRPVIQHCVVWNETIDMDVTLLVSRETDYLLPAQLRLSVRKTSADWRRRYERVGVVTIDLAYFAGRRMAEKNYLLENSASNASLSVAVHMMQTEGDPVFRTTYNDEDAHEETAGTSLGNELAVAPDKSTVAKRRSDTSARPSAISDTGSVLSGDIRTDNVSVIDDIVSSTMLVSGAAAPASGPSAYAALGAPMQASEQPSGDAGAARAAAASSSSASSSAAAATTATSTTTNANPHDAHTSGSGAAGAHGASAPNSANEPLGPPSGRPLP